jgi:hypothetical protein
MLVFWTKSSSLGNLQNMVQDGEVVSLILLISRFQAIGSTTLSKFVKEDKHKGVGDLIVWQDLRWQMNLGVFSNEHGLGGKVPFVK